MSSQYAVYPTMHRDLYIPCDVDMNSVLPNQRRMIDCSLTRSLCAESYLENFMLIGGLGEVVWKISMGLSTGSFVKMNFGKTM